MNFMFANRGFWLRPCDVLPPRLPRAAGEARNIGKCSDNTKHTLQDIPDTTPVALLVWKRASGGDWPTVC